MQCPLCGLALAEEAKGALWQALQAGRLQVPADSASVPAPVPLSIFSILLFSLSSVRIIFISLHRTWMRLHFAAFRAAGCFEACPAFESYYVRFIGHFVSVYERAAPPFARNAARWSATEGNFEGYVLSLIHI